MFGLTTRQLNELVLILLIRRRQRRRRNRTKWMHPLTSKRLTLGHYYTLIPELRADEDKFKEYFRMSFATFDELLSLLQDHIGKSNRVRLSIPAEERLVIALK